MDCPWLSPFSVYRADLFITPESCCFYFAYLICSFVDCFLNLKNSNRTLTKCWSWWTNSWALWSHRSVPHSPTRKDWRTWPSPLLSGKARASGPGHRSLCHAAACSASLGTSRQLHRGYSNAPSSRTPCDLRGFVSTVVESTFLPSKVTEFSDCNQLNSRGDLILRCFPAATHTYTNLWQVRPLHLGSNPQHWSSGF